MTNYAERPTSSETTGSNSLARRVESQTGLQHGETGCAATLSALVAGHDPFETTKTLEGELRRMLGSRLITKTDNEFEVVGYSIAEGTSLPSAEIERLRGLIGGALRMSPAKLVLEELAICDACCAARKEDEMDTEARAHAFVLHLGEYPADIVRGVFRKWPRLSEWRPTVREITVRADRDAMRRQSMFKCLDQLVVGE